MKIWPLIVLPLAGQLLTGAAFAASQEPPTFDVNPSCRAAADASGGHDRLQGCITSEQNARNQLVKEWTQFPPASRDLCVKSATAGGEPTYTELITCLEMERDAKLKPADVKVEPASTTGMGPKSAIERAHGH